MSINKTTVMFTFDSKFYFLCYIFLISSLTYIQLLHNIEWLQRLRQVNIEGSVLCCRSGLFWGLVVLARLIKFNMDAVFVNELNFRLYMSEAQNESCDLL